MVKVPIKLVSWDEITEWARVLSMKIRDSGWLPDVVVAIARGGYAPARLICDYLGITDLISIQVVHWPSTAQVTEKAYIKYPLSVDLGGKRVLVIDDIVDTGDSIQLAREYIERNNRNVEVRTAALQWISTVAKFKPDYWAIEVRDWVWFVYPWNVTEDMTNFIKRILLEEYKGGKREWTLNEIVNRMVEWYGDEVLKVKVTYIDLALRSLEKQGVIIRTNKDGVEHILFKA
ncbi:phosphoribosyltransferase [Vulcanisaeta souniana]|uniref:Phosphoribosyltransferase n=1 Tax=Vulcanisaeta souniana JCM 11219 TaxID=1293586 RepID=A0A830EKR4_9CREN|nr:phosphoribosyltransferase [Vulcanisaeta souniana]BDR91160.1 phosphoribosyltransferase [Vulcanisaeta souniana JCM 11219]GGI81306.1 phosphoribosyltransferase [Vulcanisaeta souniana JCM 11219]